MPSKKWTKKRNKNLYPKS